jgi:hypothetical protein
MRKPTQLVLLGFSILSSACSGTAVPADVDSSRHVMPTRRAAATVDNASPGIGKVVEALDGANNGITYSGGPLITGGAHIYYIWYGNWFGKAAIPVLLDFAKNLDGSPYWRINTSYFDSSFTHVSPSVTFGGTTADWYSRGKSLQQGDIVQIVQTAIQNGSLPADNQGVYFVMVNQDVHEGSYCSDYCGYHASAAIWTGSRWTGVAYAMIGDPASCGDCRAQDTGPNDAEADAMASVVAHELEESVTDPELNAWNSGTSNENGDKCAWNFGSTRYPVANGAQANMILGNRHYYIQQNWDNISGGHCALNHDYGALPFAGQDNRLASNLGDWKPNSYKAECADGERAMGISATPGSDRASSLLCEQDLFALQYQQPNHYPHQVCRTVDFSTGDNRGTTATGDWDYGNFKGECAANEYVAGVTQTTSGQVDSLLCCQGNVSHSSCSAHVLARGDSRETTGSGDWDRNHYKGECGGYYRYAAGVSRNPGSGAVDAILCCNW